MQGSNAPGWGWRIFLFIALALFLLQAALLLAAPSSSVTPLFSNLIQFASGLLAAVSCLYASRRMAGGFGKQFWLLVSTGFFMWSTAQLIATYYDSIRHAPLNAPWPSDIVFFLSMAPLFMTLFIDPERGFQWHDWPRIFDLTQVIIFTVAGFLFGFYTPADWQQGWGAVARLSWAPDSGRDLLLLVAFALSALLAQQRLARDLYGRLAVFFLFYLCGEWPYLYLQATKNLRTGTLWDFAWSVPFLVIAVIAARSNPIVETTPTDAGTVRRKRWGHWALVHVVSLVFPLVVLLMAAGIAERQLVLAVVMVIASFACSSARIIVGEQQQRRASRALEESNALLKSIFDGTGDAISMKDLEGRYLFANHALAELYQTPVEQILGKKSEDFLDGPNAQRVMEHDRIVLESGQMRTFEYAVTLGNKARTFLTTRSPVLDASGHTVGVVTIGRDISEHRAVEDRLRQSQKMEAIGTLAGGVAHDFNNILMVISGYGQVLSDALAHQPKLRGPVEQIQRASERAASLTRQLLAFSRKQTIQPEALNVNVVVTGMRKLLERLIGEHISVTTRLADDLGTVKADAGQLEQVILNLAVNARDAMPNGGRLTIQTRNIDLAEGALVERVAAKPGSYVQLEISDTGVGMDPAVQAHIFEPFFTTKPLGKGTGLGLSTVYGIVEQSGGHISCESTPGKGTTFRINLPRIDAAQRIAAPPEAKRASYQGVETVLLVEDDAGVCELVGAVLASHGYSVLTARNAKEAEALCASRSQRIDLLLTDVVMPGMSGAELAKRLSRQNAGMKVLFMSGYIDDSVIRQGVSENEVPFLQKPFAPVSLAKKVREVLDTTSVR